MKSLACIFYFWVGLRLSLGFQAAPQPFARPSAFELAETVKATGWDSFDKMPPIKDISYGERSRQFRRTVYTHDDWKKHRNQDRFFYYIQAIFKSGVYRNLAREVIFTTSIAFFIFGWNLVFGDYQDLMGVKHAGLLSNTVIPILSIPLTPFTLASPSLGLLLVFRTNTSYQRWDEARKNWGSNINRTRDLVRMANTYYDNTGISPEEREKDLNHVALCTWSYVRAMKRHLSPEEEDEADFQQELYDKLPRAQAQKIVDAAHRPNRALQDLSYSIDSLPMHFIRKNEIHKSATQFEDNLGSSERLLTSPVPVFYTRHLARFLAIWLFLLPFALYDVFGNTWNHIGMLPATAFLSMFLFGIEELATQLEEPFTILPMQAFCDKIYNWCMEISKWSPGDNGTELKPVRPEHAYFVGMPSVQSAEAIYSQQPIQQDETAAEVETAAGYNYDANGNQLKYQYEAQQPVQYESSAYGSQYGAQSNEIPPQNEAQPPATAPTNNYYENREGISFADFLNQQGKSQQ